MFKKEDTLKEALFIIKELMPYVYEMNQERGRVVCLIVVDLAHTGIVNIVFILLRRNLSGNMKTRRYTITTGNYDNYKIVAQVRGPATPALSTLWKQFKKEYEYPEPISALSCTVNFYESVFLKRFNAIERMHKHGYLGYDVAECFIQWLIIEHKFEELKRDDIWIG